VVCTDSTQVKNYLTNLSIPLSGVSYLIANSNSVWMRDYGANTVYTDAVDSLKLIDWIYNRPRPADDAVPSALATFKNIPLYATTTAPNDLVHTGGNFMVDGFGTAFSSNLVLDENALNNSYGVTVKTEADIDTIMKNYMGIDRYIKMPVLPYDGIHHIDMHMKLFDEETLIVGEYPQGVADGPQIEANLQYVLSNFNSMFGTPYKVIRVQMPPGSNGNYPDASPWWNAGEYRTYANSVFVNKTLLVPVYTPQYDTTALRIIRENLPGYNVVGIDCNQVIQAGGALHCITRAVGVENPLLISHQPLADRMNDPNSYPINALIQHKTGIANANVYYRTDTTQPYSMAAMTLTNPTNNTWTGLIPNVSAIDTLVYYYIAAQANSGKQQVRPMPAPEGYWRFRVQNTVTSIGTEMLIQNELKQVYPNPAQAITCVPLEVNVQTEGKLSLWNSLGQEVKVLHNGVFEKGKTNYFFDARGLSSGAYWVQWATSTQVYMQKILIR
ncbi:MAG: T9SS type A sorting domain-containing protein, partial [Aureispira sp.]|nr:T9SS type A sorting domain-containing protein [Aureispira sp.]